MNWIGIWRWWRYGLLTELIEEWVSEAMMKGWVTVWKVLLLQLTFATSSPSEFAEHTKSELHQKPINRTTLNSENVLHGTASWFATLNLYYKDTVSSCTIRRDKVIAIYLVCIDCLRHVTICQCNLILAWFIITPCWQLWFKLNSLFNRCGLSLTSLIIKP
jgi:hypothetical protein